MAGSKSAFRIDSHGGAEDKSVRCEGPELEALQMRSLPYRIVFERLNVPELEFIIICKL